MISKLTSYKTIIFDCDGVILNSNKVKTQAFYDLAKPWGLEAQKLLKDYHVNNGGISRHKKISYLLSTILPSLSINISSEESQFLYANLLEQYADFVYQGLSSCEVSPALKLLREHTPHSQWSVVSGGDQAELNRLFKERNLSFYFDSGIFGSPDDKQLILNREFKNKNFKNPSLFIGDSKYDYVSAASANIDFLFLSSWTEFKDWEAFISEHQISFLPSLSSLVDFSC